MIPIPSIHSINNIAMEQVLRFSSAEADAGLKPGTTALAYTREASLTAAFLIPNP